MVSSNLIFSKAAALRILKDAKRIEDIHLYNEAVQVTYCTKGDHSSTLIPKQAFLQDFTAFRQQGAATVKVRPWASGRYTNHYECRSTDSDHIHTVKLLGGTAICDCQDYERQMAELGTAECKHVYATLNYLGHASLEEYLEAQSERAKADLFGGFAIQRMCLIKAS